LDSSWTAKRCETLYNAIDSDKSGVVEMDEFVEWIVGHNTKTHAVMNERPLFLLRLCGFASRSREELQEVLEQFGAIENLHHVHGKTSQNSLVLFETEEGAKAAFNAHKGVLDPRSGKNGIYTVEMKKGTPLHRAGDPMFANQSIVISPKKCQDPDERQMVPEEFRDHFLAAVKTLKESLGDDFERWNKMARKSDGFTVKEGAKQLRLMSMNLSIRSECKQDAMMWRRTMRLLAKGETDLMDANKILDMVSEFEDFVGEDTEARKESDAAKRAKNGGGKSMAREDAWGHVSSLKSNQNSALQHLGSR